MIDPVAFRIRIGHFNLSIRNGKLTKRKVSNKHNYGPSLKSYLLPFLGILLFIATVCAGLSFYTGLNKYSLPKYVSHWNNTNQYSTLKLESFVYNDATRNLVWLSGSNCTSDWNTFMKALNGNIKNTLTIAHWNGGSSFLGKSEKGREKVSEVENLLVSNKIDVLGLSEANLDAELDDYNFKIQGYHCFKSPGTVARLVTYVRDELLCKELKKFGNDLSCT